MLGLVTASTGSVGTISMSRISSTTFYFIVKVDTCTLKIYDVLPVVLVPFFHHKKSETISDWRGGICVSLNHCLKFNIIDLGLRPNGVLILNYPLELRQCASWQAIFFRMAFVRGLMVKKKRIITRETTF